MYGPFFKLLAILLRYYFDFLEMIYLLDALFLSLVFNPLEILPFLDRG